MKLVTSLFALALVAAGARAGGVANCSTTDAAGARILCSSMVYDAPVAQVWAAVVDPATIMRWSAPFAVIDLKQGGTLEEGLTKDAKAGDPNNIRHDIIAYAPERFIILRNTNAPLPLKWRDAYKSVTAVVTFEPLPEGKTRLTVTQTGYGSDADSTAAYEFFATHNPEYLEEMKSAFASGKLGAPKQAAAQ